MADANGVDVRIEFSTKGKDNKGSHIVEEFFNQDLEKVRLIENLLGETRQKVYGILRSK